MGLRNTERRRHGKVGGKSSCMVYTAIKRIVVILAVGPVGNKRECRG